jgi:hypothetical protein
MASVKIKYVGNKPVTFDSITRSGTVWNGKGDVKEVPEATAKALLKYPDQWALENPSDIPLISQAEVIKVTDEDGDQVVVDSDALKKPLEKMSKTELKAFAKRRYSRELDARKSSKNLIDEIEELENDVSVERKPV